MSTTTVFRIDPNGPWQLFTRSLPPLARPLGVVYRTAWDAGVLVQFAGSGQFAQLNAGVIRALPQAAVRRALLAAGGVTK